jgi:hypothetical protein
MALLNLNIIGELRVEDKAKAVAPPGHALRTQKKRTVVTTADKTHFLNFITMGDEMDAP